jgi:hypothetical protein
MGIRRKKNSGSEIFFSVECRAKWADFSSRMCVCTDTCSLNVFLIKKNSDQKKIFGFTLTSVLRFGLLLFLSSMSDSFYAYATTYLHALLLI